MPAGQGGSDFESAYRRYLDALCRCDSAEYARVLQRAAIALDHHEDLMEKLDLLVFEDEVREGEGAMLMGEISDWLWLTESLGDEQ